MYGKYYLQAREAAEKIRQGQYQGAVKSKGPDTSVSSGLLSRRAKEESPPPKSQEQIITEYMAMTQDAHARPQLGKIPVQGEVKTALEALAAVESSGKYDAMGPLVQKGMYKGDRAYGKYQVMGKNIPSWTKAAFGVSMTPEEFLANPSAQDAVAAYQMQKSYDKYGTWEDAASVWFTGRPISKAGKASDGYIDVDEYVQRFQANWRTA